MNLTSTARPTPAELAQFSREDLGTSRHFVRQNYAFAVPRGSNLSERTIDAAVFSSPLPSIRSAVVGFSAAETDDHDPSVLAEFAYLGAPHVVVLSPASASVYRYQGSPVPTNVATLDLGRGAPWVREELLAATKPVRAPLFSDRDLLMADTQRSLTRTVEYIFDRTASALSGSSLTSFMFAVGVLRSLVLGQTVEVTADLPAELRALHASLVEELGGTITFANIPPDAIAEMYEALAIGDHARRRQGVVYTPSWLARFVVDRLPQRAVTTGSALDPCCGSGTFLVAYLQRVVEQLGVSDSAKDSSDLASRVFGMDLDPVAIEAARLALDFMFKALEFPPTNWNLTVGDATVETRPAKWLIGNLPFGYRTHAADDASTVILERQCANTDIETLALIMPDSLRYAKRSENLRESLRKNFRIQEVTRLPEGTFPTSSAAALAVIAVRDGPTKELLVRDLDNRDLNNFRNGIYSSRTYTAPLALNFREAWRLSPFNRAFELAEGAGTRLGDIAQVRGGLQVYGSEDTAVVAGTQSIGQPLLENPNDFNSWHLQSVRHLRRLVASRHEIRRPGPWDLFTSPKVILRSTTSTSSSWRLTAVPDTNGVWFTDKFLGVWPTAPYPSLLGLSAYFQTRFARAWFAVNNPSRKLRLATLQLMPIPKLSPSWWARASELVRPNAVTERHLATQPGVPTSSRLFINRGSSAEAEWEWFDQAVESALALPSTSGVELQRWLDEGALGGDR